MGIGKTKLPPVYLRAFFIFILIAVCTAWHFRTQAAEQGTGLTSNPVADATSEDALEAEDEKGVKAQIKPLELDIDPDRVEWQQLQTGLELLELGLFRSSSGGKSVLSLVEPSQAGDLIILRVDPKSFEFTLHMASEDGQHRSMAEQARLNGLFAAINAGMYLPDNLTNTGYMQSDTHTNNPRIAQRFGLFFVAGPSDKRKPSAALLEKSELGDNPAKTLEGYRIAVQNFRLMSADGEILWPESEVAHSISALGQDKNGRFMLIMCRYQLAPADFSRLLLALPLDCGPVMYLEGGSHASMLLSLPGEGEEGGRHTVWRGKRNSIFPDASPNAPLPNIIGLRPRAS